MGRLTGKYDHNIDSKGRIIMPAKLRAELGSTFYVAAGTYESSDGTIVPNLTLYPMPVWERICEQIASLPSSETNDAEAFFSTAECCKLDSQNRIVVPPFLRTYAMLEKDVVVVGANERAKIWDAALWNQTEGMRLTPANIARMMKRLKI